MADETTNSKTNVLGHSGIFTPDVINDIHVKMPLCPRKIGRAHV